MKPTVFQETTGSTRSKKIGLAAMAMVVFVFVLGCIVAFWPEFAFAQDKQFVAEAAGLSSHEGLRWPFRICAALTVLCAVTTISRRNPVIATLWLVATLFFTAILYLLLHATFMAAIQVLVYAGAIMVLFMFVVMSVGHTPQTFDFAKRPIASVLSVLVVGYLLFRIGGVISTASLETPTTLAGDFGSLPTLGKLFFSEYLFPFEAISLLLLVAVLGAVMVSRGKPETEEPAS